MVPRTGTTTTSVKRAELQLMVSACGAKRARTLQLVSRVGNQEWVLSGVNCSWKKKCFVKNYDNFVEQKQSFSYL